MDTLMLSNICTNRIQRRPFQESRRRKERFISRHLSARKEDDHLRELPDA